MEFTVGKPTHDSVNKYYQLLITSPPVFTCEASDSSGVHMRFVGENSDKLDMFIYTFLEKASSYFSKPLDKDLFLQRLVHEYSTGEYDIGAVAVKQFSWIPVRILFYPTRYEIHWRLAGFEVIAQSPSPGTEIQEADIQNTSTKDPPRRMLSPQSSQKRTRQKIRQARIRCAFAKLHLERMIERYYSRYGHFDGLSDADSELSSEGEP
jgi:hypothetical protein